MHKKYLKSNLQDYFCYIEWEIAKTKGNSYYIYCWPGINLHTKTSQSGPFIIPMKKMINIVPIDNSDECTWSICKVIIDLNKYVV